MNSLRLFQKKGIVQKTFRKLSSADEQFLKVLFLAINHAISPARKFVIQKRKKFIMPLMKHLVEVAVIYIL